MSGLREVSLKELSTHVSQLCTERDHTGANSPVVSAPRIRGNNEKVSDFLPL